MKQSRATEYRWYPGFLTWALRVYDRVLRRAPRLPLPCRKAVVRLRFRDMLQPFFVRLGSSDLQLHQTIRFRGEYDPVRDEKFTEVIRQVVDLGANAGFTMRLWRELFPEARLIGVEPDPGNMRLCHLNAAALPGVQLDFVQACVDGRHGSVWLDRSAAEHQFKIGRDPKRTGLKVEALTVPEILTCTAADAEIGLLKCDVQGAEQAIFADCAAWIQRVKNLIVEVHPPYTPDALLADLKRNGWHWGRMLAHRTDNLWVLFFWAAGEPGTSAEERAATSA